MLLATRWSHHTGKRQVCARAALRTRSLPSDNRTSAVKRGLVESNGY